MEVVILDGTIHRFNDLDIGLQTEILMALADLECETKTMEEAALDRLFEIELRADTFDEMALHRLKEPSNKPHYREIEYKHKRRKY